MGRSISYLFGSRRKSSYKTRNSISCSVGLTVCMHHLGDEGVKRLGSITTVLLSCQHRVVSENSFLPVLRILTVTIQEQMKKAMSLICYCNIQISHLKSLDKKKKIIMFKDYLKLLFIIDINYFLISKCYMNSIKCCISANSIGVHWRVYNSMT